MSVGDASITGRDLISSVAVLAPETPNLPVTDMTLRKILIVEHSIFQILLNLYLFDVVFEL